MSYLEITFYNATKEEDFRIDCTELDFTINANLENSIITKDMLNADGTYTVRGILGARPDSLTVNGDAVTVDKDNVFTYNVPVKGGKVRVNIVVEKDGKKHK